MTNMSPISPDDARCAIRPMSQAHNLYRSNNDHSASSSSGASSDQDTHSSDGQLSRKMSEFEEICLNREYTSLMAKIQAHVESGDPFFSLEFFPPRTQTGVANLLKRMERMEEGGPLFVDVTWHPGGDPGSDKVTSSSHIAGACLNFCYHETMLHLTCAQYTRKQNLDNLKRIKELGIRNILALRGDLPEEPEERAKLPGELNYATDLVRLIREEYGNYFTIAVAAYPCGHPEAESYQADLMHLKEKCDAGADYIITQMFFDIEDHFKFLKDCEDIGITVPIIPGFMPIQSYDSLRHIVRLSKLTVPEWIRATLEPIKHNEEAIRNFGIHQGTQMCRKLLESGVVPGIHFYTLNKEIATREILQNLDLWGQSSIRVLPWKAHTAHSKRASEEMRPIFWSSRPKAYIYRTKHWDEFPKGTWNINSSERYGDLQDYYMFYLKDKTPEAHLRAMWGEELLQEDHVWEMFTCFITGQANRHGNQVTKTPWNSPESICTETDLIQSDLVWCNSNGILTVNSQPNVNGADSDDPILGWGRPGGYIYRKAYLEFFIHKDRAEKLIEILKDNYPNVSYHIVNEEQSIDETNNTNNKPITVTWGVHPGAEVQQTTIVDPNSFRVWKDEAFDCWREWAKIYSPTSPSYQLIQSVMANYCLANLVDNSYPEPTSLWEVLRECVAGEERERRLRMAKGQ